MDRAATSFRCFAHGGNAGWEAMCVDLDIAVQGDSFDDVKQLLDHAVTDYIAAAKAEDAGTRAVLLNRRAPWWVVAGLTARLVAFNVFGRNREAQASFPVACPA